MATNHDKAARFAAVITDYMTKGKLHTAHDAMNFIDCLPKKLHRQPSVKQTMQPSLCTSNGIQFMATACNNVFLPLSNGYSYAERVARIVWNTHTQTPELWLTPQRFSNTTARHKDLYYRAYMNACRINKITPVVYNTLAVSHVGITRTSQVIVDREKTLHKAAARIKEATLPRLHAPTRYAAVIEAHKMLEYQLFLMTFNVPGADYMYKTSPQMRAAHERTVWELTEDASIAAMLRGLDVKTMRAAVAGLKALDTE